MVFKSQFELFFEFVKKGRVFYILILILAIPRLIEGFTPVDILTVRIHESSKYKSRIGAICDDKWRSNATGSGACSYHGGVSEWVYKTVYGKTIEASRKEANELSWIK